MTLCLAVKVDEGLVGIADTRVLSFDVAALVGGQVKPRIVRLDGRAG
ncbi:MAG: hypothetical protein ACRDKJ_13850 [Actinomycetota bacterium]